MSLSDDEITLIDIAVDKSMRKFLTITGWDLDDPKEIRDDIRHLKLSKKLCQTFANRYVIAIASATAASTIGATWYVFLTMVNNGGM